LLATVATMNEISLTEAATRLGFGRRRVQRLCENGHLVARNPSGRRWLIEATSVKRLARARRVA
jgi:excisionase family DNA binding protein